MSKLNIIIPLLKKGSKHNDIELKYALRSIEKHLSGYENVVIISDYLPDWIKNVELINVSKKETKTKNILFKIQSYFEKVNDNDSCFFTNDDIFLTKDCSVNYPYYYSNKALEQIKNRNRHDIYRKIVVKTEELYTFLNRGKTFNYYDIHTPIVYNKAFFNNTISLYGFAFEKYGLIIKSLYGNHLNFFSNSNFFEIDEILLKEKIIFESIPTTKNELLNTNCFSIHDQAIDYNLIYLLKDLFPLKSKYEK